MKDILVTVLNINELKIPIDKIYCQTSQKTNKNIQIQEFSFQETNLKFEIIVTWEMKI